MAIGVVACNPLNGTVFYKEYQTMKDNQFALTWEDPGTISLTTQQEMQMMCVDAFVSQYRASGSFSEFSDEKLKEILIDYFMKSIQPRFVLDGKQYFLSARFNGKLIGFIFWESLDKERAYVAELAIAKDYWRQGLGKILMNTIFDKKPLTKKIVLLTEHENKGAQNFYEALGYKASDYMHDGYSAEKFRAYELVINN